MEKQTTKETYAKDKTDKTTKALPQS